MLAAWKGGELLMGLDQGRGGDRRSDTFQNGHHDRFESQHARTLEAAKLSESTAKRWQRIARSWLLEDVERFQHDTLSSQTKNRTEG